MYYQLHALMHMHDIHHACTYTTQQKYFNIERTKQSMLLPNILQRSMQTTVLEILCIICACMLAVGFPPAPD
jgi:hypothetical protein